MIFGFRCGRMTQSTVPLSPKIKGSRYLVMKVSKKTVCTKVVLTLLIFSSMICFILCILQQPNDDSTLEILFGGKVVFEDGLGIVVYENRKRSIEISKYRVLYEGDDVDVTCKRVTYLTGEKKLEYEIKNNSEMSIIASPAYYLDANIDGKWYQIYVFPMQGVGAKILNKGESSIFFLDTTQTAGYIDNSPLKYSSLCLYHWSAH